MKFWMTLATYGIALALTFGCSTTKISSTVTRPPDVSCKGARTVRVDISVTCQDVWRGPETERFEKKGVADGGVVKVGFAVSLQKSTLKVWRKDSCSNSQLAGKAAQDVRNRIESRLRKEGHEIVRQGEADRTVAVELTLLKDRSLELIGDHNDTEKSHDCAKACKKSSCLRYQWSGMAEVSGRVIGPVISNGEKQTGGFAGSSLAIKPVRGIAIGDSHENIYACSKQTQDSPLFSEAKYTWPVSMPQAIADADRYLQKTFCPWSEDYDYVFVDVKECPACEKCVQLAKAGNWAGALSKCKAGAASTGNLNPPDPEKRAHALMNKAVILMALGKLEGAMTVLGQSLTTQTTSEAQDLAEELGRRITAREKFTSVGQRPTDPE
jgi:hypothetical protein